MEIVIAAAAALIAAAVVYMVMRGEAERRVATASADLATDVASARTMAQEVQRQLAHTQGELGDRAEQLSTARAEIAALRNDNKWLAEEIEREKKSLAAMQQLLEKAREDLRDGMKAAAAEALNANNAAFLELARTSFQGLQKEAALDIESRQKAIDGIVAPVLASLKQVDLKVEAAERERVAAYARLSEQVAMLGSATGTLSRALRTPA